MANFGVNIRSLFVKGSFLYGKPYKKGHILMLVNMPFLYFLSEIRENHIKNYWDNRKNNCSPGKFLKIPA